LAGAIGAAAVGAAIWAAIVLITNYEVGWVAWGIGGLVGGACAGLGGRGQPLAATCAGLALASILVGKFAAVHFGMEGAIREELEAIASEELYDDQRKDWTDYAELPGSPSDEQIETFILDHDYEDVSVVEFRESIAPHLIDLANRNPSFDVWRSDFVEMQVVAVNEQVSVIEIVKEDLGAMDLLFAFLGVSTAFGLVMGATRKDEEAARAVARAERRAEGPNDGAAD
jgi:hypothetical protein